MANTNVTKLNGATGALEWSYMCAVPVQTDADPYAPTLLHCDNGTLFVLSSRPNTYTDPDVTLQLVNSINGVPIRSLDLSDYNAAHRNNGDMADKYSAIVTGNGTTQAEITATSTHIFIATPRVFLGEGMMNDAGDVWAIPRDATYPINHEAYSISETTPSWEDDTLSARIIERTPELLTTSMTNSSDGTSTPYSIIEDIDYLYSLPPAITNVHPSLDVVNIASVGQLMVGEVNAPTTPKGRAGDLAGMVRFTPEGMYYCTDTYTGDGSDIWSSTPFTGIDMARYKAGPIGFSPNYGTRCGIPGDIIGDIRMCGTVMFVCTANYSSQMVNIWFPLAQYQIGSGISTSFSQNYDTTDDPAYPLQYVLTSYTNTLSVSTGGVQINDWSTGTTLFMTNAKGQINKYSPYYDGFTVNVGNPYWSYPNWTATIVNSSPTYALRIQDGWGASFNGVSQLIIAPRQSVDLFLDGSVFRTLNIREADAAVSMTTSGTITLDARLSSSHRLVLNGNATLANPVNLADGLELCIVVIQDSSGFTRTMSYGTMFKWAGGVVPALSIGANKVDMITARYHAAANTLLCTITKDIR